MMASGEGVVLGVVLGAVQGLPLKLARCVRSVRSWPWLDKSLKGKEGVKRAGGAGCIPTWCVLAVCRPTAGGYRQLTRPENLQRHVPAVFRPLFIDY